MWQSLLNQAVVSVEPEVSQEDLALLLQALGTGRYPIQGLDLMMNDYLDAEMLNLVTQLVKACLHLVFLDLSSCQLGVQHENAINHLVAALKVHPGLLSVHLDSNDLSEANLLAIVNTVGSNQILSWELDENKQLNYRVGLQLYQRLQTTPNNLLRFRCIGTLSDGSSETMVLEHNLNNLLVAKRQAFLDNPQALQSVNIPAAIVDFLRQHRYYFSEATKPLLLTIHERQEALLSPIAGLMPAFQRQLQLSTQTSESVNHPAYSRKN